MECLRAAWETKTQTPIQKLVLVRLADRANGDNTCWPGISSISKECCLSESSVRRAIAALVAAGALNKTPGGGAKTNTYIVPSTPVTQTPLADRHPSHTDTGGVSIGQGRGVTQTPGGCHTDTRTLINPHKPPSNPHGARARLHGIPSSPEEVIAFGSTLNPPIAAETCRDFWAHYEGQARTNANGEVFWITSGEAVVTNWKAKLPSFHGNGAGNGKPSGGRPATIMDLRAIQAIKEEKAKALLNRYATETSLSTDWSHEGKRQEWIALRNEIKGLKERIEKMV